MSERLDRALQEWQRKQKEQEQYWEVFPALAQGLWGYLREILVGEAKKLQTKFPALASLQVVAPTASQLEIHQLGDPAYSVFLTLDVQGQQILVEQQHALAVRRRGFPVKTLFMLSLDETRRHALLTLNGKYVTLEDVSEYCLRPLLSKER